MDFTANPIAEPISPSSEKFTYAGGTRPLEGYTIKRGIGRGGFGEVYYAVSDAGKEVALKLIRRNLEIELRGVTHCLNLKHQNLLALYDIKRDARDDGWVVMEYVNGESLEQALERKPAGLSQEEANRWLRGMFAAVAYLHEHGIVHRDLKPGNIFTDDGNVKIGDYGLSKFISCSRRSGQTESVGTVHYMAPEIANGRYGKEIDIYGLGVIVYEMLTGKVPFEGESVGEVLMKHLTVEPDLSRLPEPYRSAVAAALVKDPAKRIGSVAEFARRLGISLDGPATTAWPVGAAPIGTIPLLPNPPAKSPTLPPPPPTSRLYSEEPILRAIKEAWRQMHAAWVAANFGAPARIALGILALMICLGTAPLWGIFIGVLGGIYLVYRIVRGFILNNARGAVLPRPGSDPIIIPVHAASPQPQPLEQNTRPKKHPELGKTKRWAEQGWGHLTLRDRVRELTGSLVLAAFVAAIAPLMIAVVQGTTPSKVQYAWLGMVTLAGAWTVLIISKFWEGSSGDVILRRLVMFVAGLGIGAASFGIQHFLEMGPEALPFNSDSVHMAFARDAIANHYDQRGMPDVVASMLYFGFLLTVPRWWLQTNWYRSARVAISSIFLCVLWGYILHLFWPYPQPWGMMATGAISLAIQIASPWPSQPGAARVSRAA